jgi:hypothetical protein
MPPWAWIVIASGAVLIIVAAAAIVVLARRSYHRRMLLRLVVATEAVEAATNGLGDVIARLAVASDEELEIFADEPDSAERRALAEVHSRGRMIRDELDHIAMPKKFLPAAEAIADAAHLVAEQAACVGDDHVGMRALDELAGIDLARVRSYTQAARILVNGACEVCGLDETAVYGGGLYL